MNQLPVEAEKTIALEDEQALAEAVRLLEFTSLGSRLTNLVGSTIGAAGNLVPLPARRIVAKAVDHALNAAIRSAIASMGSRRGPAVNRRHKSLAALSGAAGGAIGIAALPIELPVSTGLILRSIADIARGEGEDMSDPATVMNCMEVFALGSASQSDDHIDSGYFAVRALLAKSVSDAAKYVASQSTATSTAPALVKFMSEIAARFGVVVTQKAAAQAVPVIGAIAGAGINYAFMAHFQGLARGHFTVRRLERTYGAERIRAEYERLAALWRDVQARGARPGG